MLHSLKLSRHTQLLLSLNLSLLRSSSSLQSATHHPISSSESEIDRIVKIVNDHPVPDRPLHPTLIPLSLLSPPLVEAVLGRLFAAHSNGLKAFQFFNLSLQNPHFKPTSAAFEKTLHILSRMRYFDKAWELMEQIKKSHPNLLTLKAMSILLSKIAKFGSYEDAIEAYGRMEREIFVEREFGVDEFNVLLRAFCTQRQMKEARSVFNKMVSGFSPNTKTMNILLLGFKESGDVTAVELFYHEMVRRGFKPNTVTYSIRIDAYCKKGCFEDGLRLLKEMESMNCLPTIETITTLIHGAGVARNIMKARELFDEMLVRKLRPDIGAYNALLSGLVRSRDLKSAAVLMDEMEEKGIGHDNITYHTIFFGLMRSGNSDSVFELYDKMVKRNFVPKTRTVVMLMKFFCENRQPDLGLSLWGYLLERGHCPHGHALDLLVTSLCSHGRVQEAFQCSKQMLERGRHMSEMVFRMLERFLLQAGEREKLRKLDEMIKRLQSILPPSRGHATGILSPKQNELSLA
ncbi:Pentatricopeptide repeat-containing protein [Actinidia chinensis var. chinensis]|uniref:Pentatricopeptide repeat-containing protein n=1 Tax=Actinidia chinensis var. chinensis TaxID=1590841 RepID=A0A2R6Q2L4_ACTCC|nr:Pentatricopeptide repeat-containing protein [Actinidia chinensis var. chinensis]